MQPVRHAGDMEVHKRITKAHGTVQEGIGAEVTAFGRGGGKGGDLKGVQRLWEHSLDGTVFQIPWESTIGGG